MPISFAIEEWSGWTPARAAGLDSTSAATLAQSPDVSLIPAMLRRRLNLLGRACASEVLRHLPAAKDTPIVYCSRHGDVERALSVLRELVAGEAVSPTHFSLAVHNAVCGILSIQAELRGNISALAAGRESLLPVLLEAIGLLTPGCERVLCVICDVPVPEPYRRQCEEPSQPFATSFVVTRSRGLALALEPVASSAAPAVPPSPLFFSDFLSAAARELIFGHNGSAWKITKN